MKTLNLFDGDMLVYHVAFAKQWRDEEDELQVANWEGVEELLLHIINQTQVATGAEDYIIYLGGSGNFRDDLVDNYKAGRSEKPFHYKNIRAYMIGMLGAEVVEGMEVDDKLCIEQTKYLTSDTTRTVICSADKDLRQQEGYHYYWGNTISPERPLELLDAFGSIQIKEKAIQGGGIKLFFSQMITGDPVDKIPGIPRKGAVAALKALGDLETATECLEVVQEMYKDKWGDAWEKEFTIQGRLLWLLREPDAHFSLEYIKNFCEVLDASKS